ncbi:MbnP family protein [Chitinophaga flava]|uniref:Copper-binding protein MbnP-like domain-containing protein n=1 Tax=Chitinophaga flava TaxID=2259036 RepID=A0A365Y161_9BACT|nr:MbnP family protein [Chitinophaga flava]RBL92240.1 hypothetical protein DF182_06490 [Chitinophaga flava]
MVLRIYTSFTFRCILLCLSILWLSSCSKKDKSSTEDPPVLYSRLTLNFSHVMNGSPLVRSSSTYINPSGESFVISRFRYYLSNFSLVNDAGKTVILPPAYFLIDDATDSTKRISLDSIPQGNYTALRFMIGVDSARNNSGVQSGALAPENGMFWTWNSGYIMAQMEGYADAVASPTHQFQFHVGGFKGPYNVLKIVSLPVKLGINPTMSVVPQLNIVADAAKWFTPDTVSFKQAAVIMAEGTNALRIANNYQQMFSIKN